MGMDIIQELRAQRDAIEARLQAEIQRGRIQAMDQIRRIAAEFNLKGHELARLGAGTKQSGGGIARYLNLETGQSWSGMGKPPTWIKEHEAAGRSREDFAIDREVTPAQRAVSVVELDAALAPPRKRTPAKKAGKAA